MSGQARTFRVFISSTFSDLKAERNAMQAHVFPRLRELCGQHGARFQPIDLRWGVSEEASLDQQAMAICLGEVARSRQISPRPNFVVLLGDRYGWMPPPAQIPDEEFQRILKVVQDEERVLLDPESYAIHVLSNAFIAGGLVHLEETALRDPPWYILDSNAVPPEWRLKPREKGGDYERYEDWQPVEARLQRILSEAAERLDLPEDRLLAYQASATHQEINAGALQQEDASEHVFCFVRQIQGLPREFDLKGFEWMLATRLQEKYPQGPSESCAPLVKAVLELSPESSAKEVSSRITEALVGVPKASAEEAVLRFMQQVLVDFTARDFVNLDEETWTVDKDAHEGLGKLIDRLSEEFGPNVFNYQATWAGSKLPSPSEPYRCITEDHIGTLPPGLKECEPLLEAGYQPRNLCEAMFRSLAKVILAEIEHPKRVVPGEEADFRIRPDSALDDEGLAHHMFAEERLRFFVGRTEMRAEIAGYLKGHRRHTLAIVGAGGTGKSALMAKAVEQAQGAFPQAQIVYRFIGVTPASSDGRSLLDSLCREISRRYGADESDIPVDFSELVPELGRRMALATEDHPLILFLDSLDQLSASQGARSLTWLPAELPEHVAVIVSTRDTEDTFQNLLAKQAVVKHLSGLSRQEGKDLLSQWLGSVPRTLQPKQQDEVLEKFEQSKGSPLYLKLAFEEARLWTSDEPPDELAVGVPGIIRHNLFGRLKREGNHGDMLVSHALGYLAASRYGLAEDELVDLLSRDLEVYRWFFRQSYHLPADLVQRAMEYRQDDERAVLDWLKGPGTPPEEVEGFLRKELRRADGPRLPIVLWSRLSFDLAPYLTERLVDGNSLLDFYHRELADASRSVFLLGEKTRHYHERLADYFRLRADPEANGSWTGNDRHGLSELPYHLAHSDQQLALVRLLEEIPYLDERCRLCNVYDLMEDYRLAASPEESTGRYREFLRKHAQRLASYPGLLFTLIQHEGFPEAKAQAQKLVADGRWHKPWLRTTPAKMPPSAAPSAATGHVEMLARRDLMGSAAVGLAADRKLAFYVERLGQIAAVDLETGNELPLAITTRNVSPLALECSADGRFLVCMFDNGKADLIRIDEGPQGAAIQSRLKSFDYLLPEFEDPVMGFIDNGLWYQVSSGSIVRLDLDSGELTDQYSDSAYPGTGELSGIIVTDRGVLISLRQGPDTKVVLRKPHEPPHLLSFPGADLDCLCTCGTGRAALALSNYTLAMLDLAQTPRVASTLTLEEPACAMTCLENTLVWASPIGSLHGWNTDGSGETYEFKGDWAGFWDVHRLSVGPGLDILGVSTMAAFRFAIPGKRGVEEGWQIEAILPAGQAGEYYAVERLPGGINLWDSLRSRRTALALETDATLLFARDDANRLFVSEKAGQGFVVDPAEARPEAVRGLPPVIGDVAGDPVAGFWLTDMQGAVYFLDKSLSCTMVAPPFGSAVSRARIHAWPGLVIWWGLETGSQTGDRLVFLQPQGPGRQRLEPLGTRFFSRKEGQISCLAYDAESKQVLLIWQSSAGFGRFARCGTPEDFSEGREKETLLSGVDLDVTAAEFRGARGGLWLLSEASGSLFRLDRHEFRVEAVLSGSERIIQMALGSGEDVPLILTGEQKRVFLCNLERGRDSCAPSR